MKTINSIIWIALAGAMISCLCPNAPAAGGFERFWFRDGQVWEVQEAVTSLLQKDIELPNKIIVSTNGTFKVGGHSPRQFEEGQILGSDGMLLSPNGTIEPVIDHVAIDAGKTVYSDNGDRSVINGDIQLGADKRLTPDHALLGADGSWMRVIDGQLFTPDGKTIPAIDTITLKNGKVVVQKEGAQIAVEPGRSMMMNEGTKVYGDGRVVSKDGQVTDLTEGEIITIEGVVKLR